MRERQTQAMNAQVNVRLPQDQKDYLDRWGRAFYQEAGALARLLLSEKIVEHAARTKTPLPQSLVDDPPRMQATAVPVPLLGPTRASARR
jgi:hypothetical protein